MFYIFVAAITTLPLQPNIVVNGQHGNYDKALTSASECTQKTFAYGTQITNVRPPPNVLYTVVCVSNVKGNGWTYNSLLPHSVDTFAHVFGAIIIDTPAACIPAHDPLLIITNGFAKPTHVPDTSDTYWIRHLSLAYSANNKLCVHGDEDKDLLYSAMVKFTPVLGPQIPNIVQTGPFYFATVDKTTYQSRVLVNKETLDNIDYERIQKDSQPKPETLSYHLLFSFIAGISAAFPRPFPVAYLQLVLSIAFYFTTGILCGANCGLVRIPAIISASLYTFFAVVHFASPRLKLHGVIKVCCYTSSAVATFALLSAKKGVWIPPDVIVHAQGSLIVASAIEQFSSIWMHAFNKKH